MPTETLQYIVKVGFDYNGQFVPEGSMIQLTEDEAMQYASKVEHVDEVVEEKVEVAPAEPEKEEPAPVVEAPAEEVAPEEGPAEQTAPVEPAPEAPTPQVEGEKGWVGNHTMS
jgi:hypothetical protein